MFRMFKPLVLIGATLIVSSAPASAQGTGPFGIDLDPFHIFTPSAEPAPAPMMKKHRMHKKMMKKA